MSDNNESTNEWKGIINYLEIMDGYVSDQILLNSMASHNYPLVFYKGNFIGNTFILDL